MAATRALDRVLLWKFYLVPQFTYSQSLCALGPVQPFRADGKYGRSGLPSLWWYDAEKAARIGKRS